jgi:hypothetical protein
MCEHNEHTSENSWWEYDARGFPLALVCDKCVDAVLAKYRPDVLTDCNYQTDEPIDSD